MGPQGLQALLLVVCLHLLISSGCLGLSGLNLTEGEGGGGGLLGLGGLARGAGGGGLF